MKRKECFFKFNQCAMCYHVFKKDEYDTGCDGDVVLRNGLIKINTGYGSRFDSANIFFGESHKSKGEKLIGKKVCDICISKELENGSLEYDFEDQRDYDDYHRIVSLGKRVLKKMADNWKNAIVRKEVETWLMVCKRLALDHKTVLYRDIRHHIAKIIWTRPYGNDPGQITKVNFFSVRQTRNGPHEHCVGEIILHFIFENRYFEMNYYDGSSGTTSPKNLYTFNLDQCESQVLERARKAVNHFLKGFPLSLLCEFAPEIELDTIDFI